MAKLGKKGVTQTWDDTDYKKYKGKWTSKKEYDLVKDIRTRVRIMSAARRTSCPWAIPSEETSVAAERDLVIEDGSLTGTNWSDRWNMDDKIYMMWREYLLNQSNLKSPFVFATVQAFLAEFQENKMGVIFTPTEEQDKAKVKLMRYIEDDWESRADADRYKATTAFEMAVRGTSIPYNGWMKKTRTVNIVLSPEQAGKEYERARKESEEETEHIKERIIKEQRPLVKKEEIVECNRCVYVPTDIFEIFVDPDARILRGPAYEAADIVWRQIPSVEQFRAEFKNAQDPWIIKGNIDKVESATNSEQMYEGSDPFFKAPRDVSGNKVELIRYYNKQTDKYIIIANDVLIRDGPLPYNHKELPFSRHIFYELKNYFYGAGLGVMLENQVAEDETTRNMLLDQQKININRPLFINTDVFQDIDLGWEYVEPGLKVEVGGSVGPDNIRWLDSPGVNIEAYRLRDTLREDAIMTSGINPLAYSVPKPGEAVRTHILAMESTLKMVKKAMKNWGEGWKDSVRQRIRIRQQMMPQSYIEEVIDGEVVQKRPTVRTEGVQIMYDFETGELIEERIKDYGYFTIEDEYLDLVGDVDVQIDSDSLVPRSHGLKVEQVDKAMAVLLPLLSNEQLLTMPGVSHLIREYVEINGLSPRIVEELQDESTQEEVEHAIEQEKAMLAGEEVPGIPGESIKHKYHHRELLDSLRKEKDQLIAVQGPMGEFLGQDVEHQARVTKITTAVGLLERHLAKDDAPKTQAIPLTIQEGQQQAPPPAPPGLPGPGGPMPMGETIPPAMMETGLAQAGPMPGAGAMPPGVI